MKLYIQIIKLLFNKFILRKNNGTVIKEFASKMGIVYIKLAQMLATQNFGNYTGGDYALDLYLKWIEQETDFIHEKENIKLYQNFADSVNDKVKDTKLIKVPKLYEEYCTDNVIVMEFIKTKTINKLELTEENKGKIVTALNSYIKSSFWALFNDKQIVFHGDPHSGNICIDDEGNICFLDMGLLCALNDNDAKLCRTFFLTAYAGNYEKLYNMLVAYGDMSEEKKMAFKEDCKNYCEEIREKEVTYYFIDMVNVCLKYEFIPPDFLFSMAKAFVCLNGISNFSNNKWSARDLLQEQTVEYLLKRSLNDCKEIMFDTLKIPPKVIESILANGIISTVAKGTNCDEFKNVRKSLENLKEMLDLIKI